MKRGEVWFVAGRGDYLSKPRPAVIVRSDAFEELSSVTICGFTTTLLQDVSVRVDVFPSNVNGLEEHSQIMVDKITTVESRRLRQRLGQLNQQEALRLDQALQAFLGLTN